ncbi:hypothetical protein Y032_0432g1358 [Ancylostoma ceylanicum]|uniref:Uncharacterized protein n=1 Tax=Ancylostoma ceylanicum TaxID=53326 RepID=A0A016X0E2_9BILA|nr:hypothetical protein Y032_0432g1358 [Ancylostoma ceylanicum]
MGHCTKLTNKPSEFPEVPSNLPAGVDDVDAAELADFGCRPRCNIGVRGNCGGGPPHALSQVGLLKT